MQDIIQRFCTDILAHNTHLEKRKEEIFSDILDRELSVFAVFFFFALPLLHSSVEFKPHICDG